MGMEALAFATTARGSSPVLRFLLSRTSRSSPYFRHPTPPKRRLTPRPNPHSLSILSNKSISPPLLSCRLLPPCCVACKAHGHGDHDDVHHHDHHHGHGHGHGGEGELNRAQQGILRFAKAVGWADLADLLREHLQLCCFSMALLLLASACPYALPDRAAKPLQNALIAIAFPLVGVSAALDAVLNLAGGTVNIHVLMALAAFASVFMGNSLEGALLLAMFNLAHIAEEYFTGRSMIDVKELKDNHPDFALLLEVNGDRPPQFSKLNYTKIPVHDLKVGSYILVRAGEDDDPRGRSFLSNSDIIWLRFIRPKTFIFRQSNSVELQPYLPSRFAIHLGYCQSKVGNPNTDLARSSNTVDAARAWFDYTDVDTGSSFSGPVLGKAVHWSHEHVRCWSQSMVSTSLPCASPYVLVFW